MQFQRALLAHDWPNARRILRTNPSLINRHVPFLSPWLKQCIQMGDVEALDFLIKNGANIHLPGILEQAYRGPSYVILMKLLDMGINMYEPIDDTLVLNLLAYEGRVQDALLLLRRGYQVNRVGPIGRTALQSAACAIEDQVEMIDLLCEWGSNVNAISRDGRPVLALTVPNIGYNLKAFERLLACGANPKLVRMDHVAASLQREVKQRLDQAAMYRRKELLAAID